MPPNFYDADCAHIKYLPGVSTVSIRGDNITDKGLLELADVKRLRHLSLTQNRITDAGLWELSRFRNLESLSLGEGNYSGKGLAQLQDAPRLQTVTLSGPFHKQM